MNPAQITKTLPPAHLASVASRLTPDQLGGWLTAHARSEFELDDDTFAELAARATARSLAVLAARADTPDRQQQLAARAASDAHRLLAYRDDLAPEVAARLLAGDLPDRDAPAAIAAFPKAPAPVRRAVLAGVPLPRRRLASTALGGYYAAEPDRDLLDTVAREVVADPDRRTAQLQGLYGVLGRLDVTLQPQVVAAALTHTQITVDVRTLPACRSDLHQLLLRHAHEVQEAANVRFSQPGTHPDPDELRTAAAGAAAALPAVPDQAPLTLEAFLAGSPGVLDEAVLAAPLPDTVPAPYRQLDPARLHELLARHPGPVGDEWVIAVLDQAPEVLYASDEDDAELLPHPARLSARRVAQLLCRYEEQSWSRAQLAGRALGHRLMSPDDVVDMVAPAGDGYAALAATPDDVDPERTCTSVFWDRVTPSATELTLDLLAGWNGTLAALAATVNELELATTATTDLEPAAV